MGSENMEFAVIGLGKMGANLALQAMEKGLHVVGLDEKEPSSELLDKGLTFIKDMKDLKNELSRLGWHSFISRPGPQ